MNDTTGPRHATASDRVDALVGLLLEHARVMHVLMGGESHTFDFDASRAQLRRLAQAPPGTNGRADRYRELARRGVGRHSSPDRSTGGDRGTGLLPCEQDG